MSAVREIIGNTTTTPVPQSDWNQTDSTKADYIKNKPEIVQTTGNSETAVMSQKAVTDEFGKILENYNTDISKYATVEANQRVKPSHEREATGSWDTYIINTDILLGINKLALYSNYTTQYAVAFYLSETISAETFISGVNFYDTSAKNIFKNISIPDGAVIAVVQNRKASGTDIEMIGAVKINHHEVKNLLDDVEANQVSSMLDVGIIQRELKEASSYVRQSPASDGKYYLEAKKEYKITFSETPAPSIKLAYISNGETQYYNFPIGGKSSVNFRFITSLSSGDKTEYKIWWDIDGDRHFDVLEGLTNVQPVTVDYLIVEGATDVSQFTISSSTKVDLLTEDNEYKTGVYGVYINSENKLTGSGSWSSWLITDMTYGEYIFKCWTTGYPSIAFYSSEVPTDGNLIGSIKHTASGVLAELKIGKSDIPEGTKSILFCSRTASGEGTKLAGVETLNSRLEALENSSVKEEDIEALTQDIADLKNGIYEPFEVDMSSVLISTGNNYIKGDKNLTNNSGWTNYVLDVTNATEIKSLSAWSSRLDCYAVAFYSSSETINESTFISGEIFNNVGANTFESITVPDNAVVAVVTHRHADAEAGFTFQATVVGSKSVTTRVEDCERKVEEIVSEFSAIEQGRGNIKAIFKGVPNSNDFTIVKDEIWFASIIRNGDGSDTGYLTIHRYKIVNNSLVPIADITADFGHWNCVDYNEDNDCLVFGNGGNDTNTEGNFFAVVPNASSLEGEISIATHGIKYPVDIGYKVQAVWGESNWGGNNIVYLISTKEVNGSGITHITKVLLKKDENGNFKVGADGFGEYTTLGETVQTTASIGVGGADFWGDTLYIGIGTRYRMALMSMTDYSVKEIEKHYYLDDGTEYTGSTQGIHVDSKYLWVFSNVTNGDKKYRLVQYYR